jgi:hypothetical protein
MFDLAQKCRRFGAYISEMTCLQRVLWEIVRSRIRHQPVARVGLLQVFLSAFFVFAVVLGSASASGLEYRFKAQDGVVYKSREGTIERLDTHPFMSRSDFSNALIVRYHTAFEVDIVHNKTGNGKYRATAASGEPREYCIVFNEIVLQCAAMAQQFVALYAQGVTLYGPFTKLEAMELSTEINRRAR